MAFVQDENQPQQGAAPQGVAQGAVSTGGAGVAGSNKTTSQPGKNVPAQPSAQLSAYLNANQQQGQQMAQGIAQNLSGQVQSAQNAITPAVNTYTGNLYTVPTDQNVNQTVSTAPSTLNPDQTSTFQTELGAAAKAPNSANTFETTQPYQDLSGQIQNAVQTANLWNAGNSPASLSTAIQPFEPSNATQGDTTLDSLLISQNPQAYGQIQQAVAPAANLQSNLTTSTNQADQALRDAIAQDISTTQAAQAAPQTFAQNLTSYLNNAVSTSTQAAQAQNAQILQDLTNNAPTQADLTALGVTPDQWNTLSGEMAAASTAGLPITLSQYLTQQAPNITAQNIATPQNYADVAALQSILGANAPVVPIGATTANEAGTASTVPGLNHFNLTGAEEAAQLAPLESKAQAIEGQGQAANSGWTYNHFGGESNADFNAYINNLNAELASLNSQMQAIAANYPQAQNISGVSNPSGGGPNVGNIATAVFPTVGVPIINDIPNIASNIGSWLGI